MTTNKLIIDKSQKKFYLLDEFFIENNFYSDDQRSIEKFIIHKNENGGYNISIFTSPKNVSISKKQSRQYNDFTEILNEEKEKEKEKEEEEGKLYKEEKNILPPKQFSSGVLTALRKKYIFSNEFLYSITIPSTYANLTFRKGYDGYRRLETLNLFGVDSKNISHPYTPIPVRGFVIYENGETIDPPCISTDGRSGEVLLKNALNRTILFFKSSYFS